MNNKTLASVVALLLGAQTAICAAPSIRDRIVNGSGSYELEMAKEDVQALKYNKATEHFLKVIEAGYANGNSTAYFEAAKWLNEKLWKHQLDNDLTIIATEQAYVDLRLKQAEKESDPVKRKEYTEKADEHLKIVEEKQEEIDNAIKKLMGN